MKVLFEVPLKAGDHKMSQFIWLKNKFNWLFVIEDGKRMRTLSIDQEPGKELQSATLADGRTCTNLSWNRDGSLLALIVDKRQIYFWKIQSNNFTHFKPTNRINPNNMNNKRGNKSRDIELVVWSRVSNRLVISYSNGQLLLCNCESTISEKFIDNSNGVLREVSMIESCEHLDIFVCLTIISEVLVMTFNGETKFYIQCDNMTIVKAKFSMPFRNSLPASVSEHASQARFQASGQLQPMMGDQSFWLAYQSKNEKLFLKKVQMDEYSFNETTSKADIVYNGDGDDAQLVDFHWLSSTHMILCFSSGIIVLLQIKSATNAQQIVVSSLISDEILDIRRDDAGECFGSTTQSPDASSASGGDQVAGDCLSQASLSSLSTSPESSDQWFFKSFKVMNCHNQPNTVNSLSNLSTSSQSLLDDFDRTRSFSLAAITSHKLFYYELFQIEQQPKYSFERVDDLDLTKSLQKVSLKLERMDWCHDCSMLAVQLTNSHILVYRTRLKDYMVASYGSKTAYLSGTNEITILNYGSKALSGSANGLRDEDNSDDDDSQFESATTSKGELSEATATAVAPAQTSTYARGDNALVINVDLRPAVMAIGPEHLAVALNNRVRLYLISRSRPPEASTLSNAYNSTTISLPFYEQEYVSIVVALSLCSRYIAVHFNDGRLKLHAIISRRLFEQQINNNNSNGIKSSRPTVAHRRTQAKASSNMTMNSATEDHLTTREDDIDYETELGDERFFPDPTKPERISAFILTEELLIYCTHELFLNVFSLKNWTIIQTCEHSKQFYWPILKLKANERGNKFICLIREVTAASTTTVSTSRNSRLVGPGTTNRLANKGAKENNVYLYDLYTNQMVEFLASDLYERIFDSQLITLLPNQPRLVPIGSLGASAEFTTHPSHAAGDDDCDELTRGSPCLWHRRRWPKFNRISDAVWDTDGRTVLLTERKSIHITVVLDHTLEREKPIIVYVASADKASSYTTLYASQGIVSFQTSLGRVINSVSDSHDDELKLTQLERDVQEIIESATAAAREATSEEDSVAAATTIGTQSSQNWVAQANVMSLKLAYLRMILPIYSLSKCKEICEHLMNDEQFNFSATPNERIVEIDNVIWRQLAAWALFTMNLQFAMLIYRKRGLLVNAHVLSEIVDDSRKNKGLDAKSTVKTRLLVLLGCDMNNDDEPE